MRTAVTQQMRSIQFIPFFFSHRICTNENHLFASATISDLRLQLERETQMGEREKMRTHERNRSKWNLWIRDNTDFSSPSLSLSLSLRRLDHLQLDFVLDSAKEEEKTRQKNIRNWNETKREMFFFVILCSAARCSVLYMYVNENWFQTLTHIVLDIVVLRSFLFHRPHTHTQATRTAQQLDLLQCTKRKSTLHVVEAEQKRRNKSIANWA